MATEEPVVVTEVAAPAIEADVTVVVEKEPAVEAAEGKPTKSKKTSAKRKPRSPSLHPPYFEMIKEAILTLKEKSGSSQYAIAKFVEEKQKNLPAKFKKVLLIQLKRLVAEGKLVKVKASYKLPATKLPVAAAPAKKKPAAKPKASAKPKPKPAAKKAPVKKKPAAKPKPTPKAKPAPKAKAVAKPRAAAKPKPKAKPVAKVKAAAPKAVAKPAVKAKPKTPTKPAKVARTSTRSTPRGKAAPAPKVVNVASTSTRSTPRKASAAVPKAAAKKGAAAAKSVKAKGATPKKAAATRKGKK